MKKIQSVVPKKWKLKANTSSDYRNSLPAPPSTLEKTRSLPPMRPCSLPTLNIDQWNRVLDRLVKEEFLSSVDPESLLKYLRQSGLSNEEEDLIRLPDTRSNRMNKLERFLRTRPSLQNALREGLEEQGSPLLFFMDCAIADVQTSRAEYDPEERLRITMRRYDTYLSTLADWAIPGLRQTGCLTRSDEEDLRSGRRRLIDILIDKPSSEWPKLLDFLKDKHSDLYNVLNTALQSSCDMGFRDVAVQVSILQPAGGNEVDERSDSRMDIRLDITGQRKMLHAVRPDDTIGSIVDSLVRSGRLMGVSGMRLDSNCSLMVPNWRRKPLSEAGINAGSTICIDPVWHQMVRIGVHTPTSDRCVAAKTISIPKTANWDLSTTLEDVSGYPMGPSTVLEQGLCLYLRGNQERRAINSFNINKSIYVWVDEDTGFPVPTEGISHYIQEFVTCSTIRAAVDLTPVLQIYPSSEVFIVDGVGDLCSASVDDLLFPTAAAFFRGFRRSDSDGGTLDVLLQLNTGKLVDGKTGNIFSGVVSASGSLPGENCSWRRTYILLNSTSLIPRYNVPEGNTVLLYMRSGMDLLVEGQRLRIKAVVNKESSWISSFRHSDLETNVTRAMRR